MCVQFVHVLFILPNCFCLFVVQSLLTFVKMHNGHIFSRILVFVGKKFYHFQITMVSTQVGNVKLGQGKAKNKILFVCDFVECFSKTLSQGSSFYVVSKSPS